MSRNSKRYVKRIWRVPKNRGALECFATLVLKMMVKHGWPAHLQINEPFGNETAGGFSIHEQGRDGEELPADMQAAFEAACRIVAKTYRVEYRRYDNWADLTRAYRVTQGGHFREIQHGDISAARQ